MYYRGCELQGREDNNEYYYYSQTETAFNNELYLLQNSEDHYEYMSNIQVTEDSRKTYVTYFM